MDPKTIELLISQYKNASFSRTANSFHKRTYDYIGAKARVEAIRVILNILRARDSALDEALEHEKIYTA